MARWSQSADGCGITAHHYNAEMNWKSQWPLCCRTRLQRKTSANFKYSMFLKNNKKKLNNRQEVCAALRLENYQNKQMEVPRRLREQMVTCVWREADADLKRFRWSFKVTVATHCTACVPNRRGVSKHRCRAEVNERTRSALLQPAATCVSPPESRRHSS